MSRSKKGTKPPGYEYWGKRPGKLMSKRQDAKRATHKKERAQGKVKKKDTET